VLQLCFGLLVILYERKFFPYHYSRILWAFVPFAIIGLRYVWQILREIVSQTRSLPLLQQSIRYCLLTAALLFASFFSPLTRIVTNPLYWVSVRLRGADVGAAADSKFDALYYQDQEHTAAVLRSSMRPSDKMFLWGNNVGLYFRSNAEPMTICLTNTPFVTSWTPKSWRDTLIDQLRHVPPRFFVCETGDQRYYITGDSLDSRQHMEAWADLRDFVRSNYHDKATVGHFIVFEHN
jgi:hypothetical protein